MPITTFRLKLGATFTMNHLRMCLRFFQSFEYSSSRNTNAVEFSNGKQGMKDFSKMSIQIRGVCMEKKHRLRKQVKFKKLNF